MKITQIQPWINSDEANYIKKIVQKKYLTESKETEKFESFKTPCNKLANLGKPPIYFNAS